MGRDDGRTLTPEEWKAIWGEEEEEDGGCSYILPKMYPGSRVRCPNCGYWQGNEAVIDTYRWCMRCCTVLQESDTLYWDTSPGVGPFRVVAASYGHPRDPKLAIDVRPQLQTRVGVSDRLVIKRKENLVKWLGNPCPGVLKALRVRYVSLEGVAKGRRREVWFRESEIDVTEFMQGRVDLANGKYLFISRKEPLTDLFGDPCPGRDKCLLLRYEIVGTEGRAEAIESDGRLLTPISISCTPILAPLILVESATYGQTREGIDERLQIVQRELSDLLALQNRKDMGLPLGREDNKRLMRLRPLIADVEYLKTVIPRYVDVRACLQARVEEHGGGLLELVAGRVDANQLFGNPLPGKQKELRVRYLVVGHDSERLTSLEETTSSGYPRNFILQRKGQVVVQARDDCMARGILEKDVLVDSPKVLPVLEILTSSYGHPRNATKTYDISSKLRQMIEIQGGEKLVIDTKTDLSKLFDEPCRGVRKKINITYVARGLNGTIRVNEQDRHLVADIIVGYYSRQSFRESELLAARHGQSARDDFTKPQLGHGHGDWRDGGGGTGDGEQEGDVGNTPLDANAGGCFPVFHDDANNGKELQPTLTLRQSAVAVGAGGGTPTSPGSDFSIDGDSPPSMAERRRRRHRERRQAHQESIRRNEAEREVERRRMRADKERRERAVARAVRETEDAERARLLRESQEAAEKASPVPAKVLRTVQRMAAGVIAAAASKTSVATVGVVERTVVAGDVAEGCTTAVRVAANGAPTNSVTLGPDQLEQGQHAQNAADLAVTDRRRSEARLGKESVGFGNRGGFSNIQGVEGGNPAGRRPSEKSVPKTRRGMPKQAARDDDHTAPDQERNGDPGVFLAAATAKNAASIAKEKEQKSDLSGGLPEIAPADSTEGGKAGTTKLGRQGSIARRKLSAGRSGEPRAVYVHRASLISSSGGAFPAGDTAEASAVPGGDSCGGRPYGSPANA